MHYIVIRHNGGVAVDNLNMAMFWLDSAMAYPGSSQPTLWWDRCDCLM